MSILLALIGLSILAFVLFDLIVTTLTMDGGGPISNWLAYNNWKLCRKVNAITRSSHVLMISGSMTLSIIILFWVAATWLGWTLIFSWDAMALTRDGSERPADFFERLYFAGYTITTIGYGDFRAASKPGQFASVVAGINGLSLLTLAVTYGIQVLTAVAEKRRVAVLLHTVESVYIPDSYSEPEQYACLSQELSNLDTDIAGVAQKYLAYPVIQFFPDRSSHSALPLKVAMLWRCIATALINDQKLSAATRAQFKKTEMLVRSLVVNAVESHGWSSRTPTFECLLRDYVCSAGWSWEHDVEHPAPHG